MGKATSMLFAKNNIGCLLCVLALGLAGTPCVLEARPCESLLTPASPTVSIIEAVAVETGTFTPTGSSDALSHLPPFCRPRDRGLDLAPRFRRNGKFLAVGPRHVRQDQPH